LLFKDSKIIRAFESDEVRYKVDVAGPHLTSPKERNKAQPLPTGQAGSLFGNADYNQQL
jgi:hypothetical protein